MRGLDWLSRMMSNGGACATHAGFGALPAIRVGTARTQAEIEPIILELYRNNHWKISIKYYPTTDFFADLATTQAWQQPPFKGPRLLG